MTVAERHALLRIGHPGFPSLPDGTVNASDRWALTGTFRFIPVTPTPRRTRPYRGQRSEQFFIEVLTEFGDHLTYLKAAVGGRIDGVTGAPISRTLSGLVLKPRDWEDFDLAAIRLKPVMVIDDVAEDEGVFVVVDDVRHPSERGEYLELQCADQGDGLQATVNETWNLAKGGAVGTAIADILDSVNVYDRTIVDANPTTSAHLGRPIGALLWDAVAALSRFAGLTPPWYDRHGSGRVMHLPYVGVTPPAGAWEPGATSPLKAGVGSTARARWNVPNRWVTLGKSDDAIRYAGVYTLPASHPMSALNRHKTITAPPVEIAGLNSQDDADARARDAAQTDPKVHATREVEVRADPTIEPWQIRTVEGEDWLIASWSHVQQVGSDQQVKLRESVMA